MFVDDLDLPAGTISEAAQRMIDCAVAEARRRGHDEVVSGHLFFGFVQVEWTLFAEVMRDVEVSPADLFVALLEDPHGAPLAVLRQYNLAPGMPRGIVGSPRGGVLKNQLTDNPCTVVLLDEVEKASPQVLNLLLQAFDEGWLTDGRGRRVHLSDALVIMTSNVGSEHFRKLSNPLGFLSREVGVTQVQADVRREVERRFTPEFLNRIDEVVLFSPLTHAEAREIAMRYLAHVTTVRARAGKVLDVDDEALELLVAQGYSPGFGERFLKRAIDERVKLPISKRWRTASRFRVRARNGQVVIDAAATRLVSAEPSPAYEVA